MKRITAFIFAIITAAALLGCMPNEKYLNNSEWNKIVDNTVQEFYKESPNIAVRSYYGGHISYDNDSMKVMNMTIIDGFEQRLCINGNLARCGIGFKDTYFFIQEDKLFVQDSQTIGGEMTYPKQDLGLYDADKGIYQQILEWQDSYYALFNDSLEIILDTKNRFIIKKMEEGIYSFKSTYNDGFIIWDKSPFSFWDNELITKAIENPIPYINGYIELKGEKISTIMFWYKENGTDIKGEINFSYGDVSVILP